MDFWDSFFISWFILSLIDFFRMLIDVPSPYASNARTKNFRWLIGAIIADSAWAFGVTLIIKVVILIINA